MDSASLQSEPRAVANSVDPATSYPASVRKLAKKLGLKLSVIQQHAIEARMALIVGAEQYDRLFLGFQCTELEGGILFVDALDEDCAAEIEDRFSLHIAIIATEILGADVASWSCFREC